jgi:NADH dehydrogenase
MKVSSVCVLGGTGFVGSHVVRQLAARGIRVRVPTRRRERAKGLIVLPTVDVVNIDVHDAAALQWAVEGCDAVINLIGILHETHPGDFVRLHAELPRRIVDACRKAAVRRMLHVSALKVSRDAPSAYLRSKADGEQQVRNAQASGIRTTIFRPSVIFGPEDSFLNLFARLAQTLPAIVLACPKARFQPVYVEDVARAVVESLELSQTYDQSLELCGPAVYTLQELVKYVCTLLQLERPILPLNDEMSHFLAWMMEFSPVKLLSRDNYNSMKVDNVCDCPFPAAFGFRPSALESVAPSYFLNNTPRSRYRWFRFRARH